MTKRKSSTKPAESRRRRQSKGVADWGGVGDGILRKLIETVTLDGGAIRFGYSRDGGAYCVGVYGDGKPYTEFLPATGDIDEWLAGFTEDYE
jgi:hypothetical protein